MTDMPADYEAMKASYAGGDASAYSGIYDMLIKMEQNGDLYLDHGFLRPRDFGG